MAVPKVQSSVNNTAGPTKYRQVLSGTFQVPSVTTVYGVPCTVGYFLCTLSYYRVPSVITGYSCVLPGTTVYYEVSSGINYI